MQIIKKEETKDNCCLCTYGPNKDWSYSLFGDGNKVCEYMGRTYVLCSVCYSNKRMPYYLKKIMELENKVIELGGSLNETS